MLTWLLLKQYYYDLFSIYTNSAVWLSPPSFSVQALLFRWNVSYLSKCIDLILLRFLRFVFLDVFFFTIHLRVWCVNKTLLVPFTFTFGSVTSSKLSTYTLQPAKHTAKRKLHGWLHSTCLHKQLTNLKKQSHYIKNVTLSQFNTNSKFLSKPN